MENYLIGIDVGTTNVKVVAFNIAGNSVAQASRPTPVTPLEAGSAVYDPDVIWHCITALIQEVLGSLPPHFFVEGVAVTGMGESGLLLDKTGKALYPMIAWFDKRMVPVSDWWKSNISQNEVLEITGQRVQYILAANKIMWIKSNFPEIFSRAWKWVCAEGFVAYCLTGEAAMEHSIACRTMLMELAQRKWSERLLNHAGIPQHIMPQLVPAGGLIGVVTHKAASQTGLLKGTPVFAGGHDHVCGAFASGVIESEQILDSSGTAELVLTPISDKKELYARGNSGFNIGTHVAPGRFYASGGITASGATMDWFQKISGITTEAASGKVPGAHGLIFLPHLRGGSSPLRDANSRGAFIGITDNSSMPDFSQAVCEGVCMEYRLVQESLLRNRKPKSIIAIGGGTRNPHWLQTKANIIKTPIEVPQVRESTALGAAMLAGIGAHIYKDAEDALAKTYHPTKRIEPDFTLSKMYDDKFEIYRGLYNTLIKANYALSENG